jgi:hypothetical protein
MGNEVLVETGEILWIGCVIMKRQWIDLSRLNRKGRRSLYTYGLIDITILGTALLRKS